MSLASGCKLTSLLSFAESSALMINPLSERVTLRWTSLSFLKLPPSRPPWHQLCLVSSFLFDHSSDSHGAVSVFYHPQLSFSSPACCCHQLQIHISSDLLSSEGGTNGNLGGALAAHTGVPSGVSPSAFPLTFQRPKLKPLSASHLATSSPPGFLWPALFWVSLFPTHLQALWPTQRATRRLPGEPSVILGRLPLLGGHVPMGWLWHLRFATSLSSP